MLKIGDKVVVFTDIHFGLRNNCRTHNQECEDFIKWMIIEAQKFGADYSICMGDWHHYRSSVQISTLNYSISSFELLNKHFKKHFQITGNHDLFYKDKREINSVEYCRNLKNIHLINKPELIGDVMLVPWLVGNEAKHVAKQTVPYMFGHFEFPHFLMNALVEMPDVGHISMNDFKTKDQTIFSGHFHKRQTKINAHDAEITYIGNCFPHSFSDAWDDQRGIMLLELGKTPQYVSWPKAPKFRTFNLSELIISPETKLDSKTTAKVTIDLDITYEEANFIRETMISEYKVKELKLIPQKQVIDQAINTDGMVFETVDQIVTEQLQAIDSNTLDKGLLVQIYNEI